eukprot:Hpha_TRINITY_DN25884_c0_g1::TRINITY_DN25884_c0_g1_i1::g.19972::m.19972
MSLAKGKMLAVLYSSGGLGDCGRHAVAAALELGSETVSKIKVLTKDPATLEEKNWKCGCDDHVLIDADRKRLEIVAVDVTTDDLSGHLEGVDAVVSGLGNRQPFWGDRVAKEGTENLIRAMKANKISRLVAVNSMGVEEDRKCMEWRFEGKLMDCLFKTLCRREFNDLTGADRAIRANAAADGTPEGDGLDYVIVRPVGIGEKFRPRGEWFLQKKKGEDWVGPNMAKMDVARFMVREAVVEPTIHNKAVVIGSAPGDDPRAAFPDV